MGLAAGQARLLTITARKSDCEYQSMRLSHQKIALSRQLADLSNEYQNSLDQTKLIYDYYGTGDESTPLSYGLCMTPSALNEYMPILLTDQLGRVTLNSKYAAAARAAGIPQEGLGTLPSQKMRNAFIQALAGEGLITDQLASTIQLTEYNQGAGFGDNVNVVEKTIQTDFNGLLEYLDKSLGSSGLFTYDDTQAQGYVLSGEGSNIRSNFTDDTKSISIKQLLNGSYEFNIEGTTRDDKTQDETKAEETAISNYIKDVFLPAIKTMLMSALCPDESGSLAEQAFEYANQEIVNTFFTINGSNDYAGQKSTEIGHGKKEHESTVNAAVDAKDQDYLGFVYYSNSGREKGGFNSACSINLNNIAQAYLTFFVDKMNGQDKTGADGLDEYNVNFGHKSGSNLVNSESDYVFTIYTGTEVVDSDLQLAAFYDTIFNQICASGWTENNNIEDNEYLQNMLQSGMLFISKVKDDGYYYQGNYATDSYIKEITDDSAIAEAEAKYNTEKAKLNSKEETLDLKMKNLDTEISSLTTEYDTVKNTISKNIEKSFKRYNA